MSFIEYKTTRARKPLEELESAKDWQAASRRLYLPLDAKKYGLQVKKWTEDGKPRHSIVWKSKPYARLLLNNKKSAKDFAMLEVNTERGLAIQVDPANYKRCYVSIPKGALEQFPANSCMLEFKREGAKYTLAKK